MKNNYKNKKYDIFISYRHNNMTLIGEFIHKLEPYYDVFWDQRLESGYWDKQLEKAMDNSKVVVINLNTNSLKKNSEGDDWFYKEIVYSMNTKNATEIIPICYDNYKIPDELNIEGITDEEKDKIKILREKQQAIVNTQILDDIVSRLVTYLDGLGIKTKIPYEPAKVEPEFLELDLISPTKAFKGREDEVKKIDQLFRDNDTVFLSGIGGIGKTDLAKKYLEKKTGEYRCVFCKYDGNLENTLRKIKISGFDEDSFQKKEKILKKLLNENVLLVIDNFDFDNDECIDDYTNEFCKYSCKKLITTRNNFTDIEFDNKTSQLNIDTLKYEDLKSLFTEKYKNSISDEIFRQVLDLTGSLTLAVIIMASFCAKSGRSPEELCKMLSDGLNNLENKEKIKYYKDGNKQGTIPQIIRELFNLSDMDDEKKNTLRNLSLLNFMYVTRTIYREIAFFNSEGTFDIFDELKDTNWIKEIPGATEDTTYFELHPIINDLVREDLKPSPNNCPEFFENVDEFSLKIEKFYEENNYIIGRNHEPIFDESEKTEWLEAFLNNLDLSIKDNYEYTAGKLKKIDFNQTLIIKLEKLLLQKDEIINQYDKEVAHYCLIHKGYENGVEILKKISKINQKDNPQIILNKFPDVMRAFFDIMLSRTNNNVLQMREASKDECNTMNEKLTYPSDEEFKKLLKKDMTFDECSVIINDIYKLKETKEEDFDYEYKNKFRSFIRVYLLCKLNVLPFNMCKSLIINSVDGVTDNTGILGSAVDDNRFEILIDALSHYMTQNYKEFETKMTEYLRKMIIDRNSIDFTNPLKEFLGKYKISSYYLIDVVHNYILFLEGSIQKENDFDLLCRTWYTWAYDLAKDLEYKKYADLYSQKLRNNKKTLLGYALK